jgi:AcrR family transcriptional regulator
MLPTDSPTPLKPSIRQRSTRDRPAKAPLSEGAVVDAALAILKSDGLEAVTMRRVAAALDTGAASLYVYISGREGLLGSMLDRVTGSIDLEDPNPALWRAQLHSLLQRVRQALVDHPGIATMTLADPPTTEPVLRLAENLLGILLAAGLDPQTAAWGSDTFVSLVTATAREDEVRHPRRRSDDDHRRQVEEVSTTFAGLSPERFPLLSKHAAQLVAGNSDDRFRFAVDVVIDGLVAQTART